MNSFIWTPPVMPQEFCDEDSARHEAGHAIMYLANGVRVDYVRVNPWRCQAPPAPPRVAALAATAGYIANKMAGVRDFPSDSDREVRRLALQELGESACPRVVKDLERQCERDLDRCWRELGALEPVLVRNMRLGFERVQLATLAGDCLRQFRHLFPARPAAAQALSTKKSNRGWRTAGLFSALTGV
jgi:hypothetical protein